MKKRLICILPVVVIVLFCGAKRNVDENIRFGMPGHNGTVMTKKGFVLLHDNYRKVPVWTSYMLSKERFENNVKYRKIFAPDPNLKKGDRAVNSDYTKQKRYDRGRMADSKAMLQSEISLKHSMYLSNVCPMEGSLNRGKWRELEAVVRKFALRKKVWVTAGPVFADTDKDGKKNNKGTIGKNKVHVPTHFYKIILFQADDFSFQVMAFLFKNTYLKKDLRDYLTTTDKIEKLTGLDFMHLLPDNVESIIESKVPSQSTINYFFQ